MPALKDLQHERFARELVEQFLKVPPPAKPHYEAYRLAGFKAHRGNCYRLARTKEVAERIAELMAEAREYLDLRIVKALVQVGRIANATVPSYYQSGADGTLQARDITQLPPQLAEAVQDIELGEDGKVVRVRLYDKVQALAILLRHFGAMPDEPAPKTEVNIYNALSGLSAEDQRALADALEALGRDPVDAVAGPAAAS